MGRNDFFSNITPWAPKTNILRESKLGVNVIRFFWQTKWSKSYCRKECLCEIWKHIGQKLWPLSYGYIIIQITFFQKYSKPILGTRIGTYFMVPGLDLTIMVTWIPNSIFLWTFANKWSKTADVSNENSSVSEGVCFVCRNVHFRRIFDDSNAFLTIRSDSWWNFSVFLGTLITLEYVNFFNFFDELSQNYVFGIITFKIIQWVSSVWPDNGSNRVTRLIKRRE